jgi:CubicO group peptidase (beta-lactamase class C family)
MASLIYGIVHQEQMMHVDQFEYRNIGENLPIDEETMFSICSMANRVVSSVLGIMIDERKVKLDDYVTDLNTSFAPHKKIF